MDVSLTTHAWRVLRNMGGADRDISVDAWRAACPFLNNRRWYDARLRLLNRKLIEPRGQDQVRIAPGREPIASGRRPFTWQHEPPKEPARDRRRGRVARWYQKNRPYRAEYMREYRKARAAKLRAMLA